MANIDYNNHEIIKSVLKIIDKSNFQICNLFKSIINIYQMLNNKYTKLTDIHNNQIIIYNNFGELLIPQCIAIKEIEIQNKLSFCYADIPIKFLVNNVTTTGFLTDNGIIKIHSEQISWNIYIENLVCQILKFF